MSAIAKHFFTQEERDRIDAAVEKAERGTAGEIVAVLASRSCVYERACFMAALAMVLFATVALFGFYCLPLDFLAHDPWDIPLYILVPVQTLALAAGYRAARVSPRIQKAFISRAFMQRHVDRAARKAFHHFGLSKTRDATGILIYVSLFERMAVVLPDKAIHAHAKKDAWETVKSALVEGLKSGRAAEGFENAIAECGRLLEKDFPIKAGDRNELPNRLRIV